MSNRWLVKKETIHPDVLLLADGDSDAYIRCGEKLLVGDPRTFLSLMVAIQDDIQGLEEQNRSLALECLSCYGNKHFQRFIDLTVSNALYSTDEDLLFCAVACYPDMSKEIQKEHLPQLRKLGSHQSESIKRAVKAELEWRNAHGIRRS